VTPRVYCSFKDAPRSSDAPPSRENSASGIIRSESGRVIPRKGIGIRSRGGNQARRRRCESTAAVLATRDMKACYSRIFGLPGFPDS